MSNNKCMNKLLLNWALKIQEWTVLSYISHGKAQVSPEGGGIFNQVVSRQPQVLATVQPLVIGHMVGLVLIGRELGAWGVGLIGDASGGELDGFTLVLKIGQQLSADPLQGAGGRIRKLGVTWHVLCSSLAQTYRRDLLFALEYFYMKTENVTDLSLHSRLWICFWSSSLVSLLSCSSLLSWVRTGSLVRTVVLKLFWSVTQLLMSWLYSCLSWRKRSAESLTWTHKSDVEDERSVLNKRFLWWTELKVQWLICYIYIYIFIKHTSSTAVISRSTCPMLSDIWACHWLTSVWREPRYFMVPRVAAGIYKKTYIRIEIVSLQTYYNTL